jgi:hypothetical protein
VRLFLVALVSVPSLLQAAISVLPGVTYYEGSEQLNGRFAFLVRHDAVIETNFATAASIYTFDLSQKKLREVTGAPKGSFVSADCGDMFCVVFRPGNWFRSADTNVFIYSDNLRQPRTVSLERPVKQLLAAGGHVFLEVESTNGSRLIDYELSHDQKHQVQFADASRWQYERYDRIHMPPGMTNILHFYYNGFGRRLADGKDYRDGYYSLDVPSGEIRWFAELLADKDDSAYTYKAANGHYIFFEGPDAPVRGVRLVSSPWDFRETKRRDPKGQSVKVLKTFPRLWGGNAYILSQTSPDGRYLLVRLQEPRVPKAEHQPGWRNTYFLVNALSGETRNLLKDEVEQKTSGSMSAVRWTQ